MANIHIDKIFWGLRALIYKVFFKKFELPSYIGEPTFLEGVDKVSIGKRVRIFPRIRMEAIDNGSIVVNDNVYIGQNCHITSCNSELVIGAGTAIMANVCITNIDHEYCQIGKPVLSQTFKVSDTKLGENCFIGHNAVIQAGTILGKQCIVGANSMVRGHFPDYCVIVGVPAKVVKRYDIGKKEWIKV